MKEVMNRRQDVIITGIDPVIENISGIETQLSTDGFVKNTDYASTSKGGTIKTATSRATAISGSGILEASTITAANYASANNGSFVSKGTLDNLIAAGTLGGGVTYSADETKIGTLFGEDLYCKVVHKANNTAGSVTITDALPANCPYVFVDVYIKNDGNGDWFAGPTYNSATIYNNIYYVKSTGVISVNTDGLTTRDIYLFIRYTKPVGP